MPFWRYLELYKPFKPCTIRKDSTLAVQRLIEEELGKLLIDPLAKMNIYIYIYILFFFFYDSLEQRKKKKRAPQGLD